MKFFYTILSLIMFIIPSSTASAILLSNYTISNPKMDGIINNEEWNAAGYEYDENGLEGATYAMWKTGLNYGSWSYSGIFSFLLHNIEQNTTYSNGADGTDPAYNVFDIYSANDSNNKYLEVTVRYDGFSVAKYDSDGSILDTRSFHYGVDLAPEQTASYDWDYYWGVYAKGGYGNSAFTSGLTGSINNDNQLFEVAYRDQNGRVRRSIKDPDRRNNWRLVTYLDTEVVPTPEPATILLGNSLSWHYWNEHKKEVAFTATISPYYPIIPTSFHHCFNEIIPINSLNNILHRALNVNHLELGVI